MGDFNINLNKVTPELKSLLNWGKQENLTNMYLAEKSGTIQGQLDFLRDPSNEPSLMYTWYRKEGITPVDHTVFGNLLQVHEEPDVVRSHIDHVWVSSDLIQRKCVSHYNVCKQAIASTDHRPVLISLNIKEALEHQRSTRTHGSTHTDCTAQTTEIALQKQAAMRKIRESTHDKSISQQYY